MAELRAYQPSFTAGVLSPSLHARVDLAKFGSGLKEAKNVFIHAHGGISNRAGTEFVREVKNSANQARLVPFSFNTEQTYMLEFGNLYMRVYKDGGIILSGPTPYEIVTPYTSAQAREIVFAQEADVMYITHVDHPVYKLSRLGETNWTLAVVDFVPSIDPPENVVVTKPGDTSGETGYTPTDYRYRVSAVDDDTGEESFASSYDEVTNDLTIEGGRNRIEWDAVAGAGRYLVYKQDAGVYGYIGGTDALFFEDENITADLADTIQKDRNPFTGPNKYPRCVSFVEQRLAFASTKKDPQTTWLSQSGNYENFNYASPSKASDAVRFRIKAREVNEIRAMLPMKGLMILTSGAEFIVSGGSQSDAITPSSIKVDPQGYRGVSKVQPIIVGNTVLFAQARGGVIRDFSYEYAQDAFVGKDLTILARHLFENKNIVAWAFAQAPSSVVWVVLDDGSLVSLTYMKEHDVWGWTVHESGAGAYFEDVAVIAEGNEDTPYFIVRRTINGATVRYVERLHTRVMADVSDAFFIDCGLTYSGAPISVISAGLEHLEGQEVAILADGNVVRGLAVSGGGVTLPNPASKIHVGLPIEAFIETLDLDLGSVQGIGTVQGRQKSVSEVVLKVERTRGIFVGPYDGELGSEWLVEYKQRQTEAWNEAIQLYTGNLTITPQWDWNDHGSLWIKQFDPLPMTILAVAPDVTIGR